VRGVRVAVPLNTYADWLVGAATCRALLAGCFGMGTMAVLETLMTPAYVHRRAVSLLNPALFWYPMLGLDGYWRYWGWLPTWTASGFPGWARVAQVTFDSRGRFVRS
jgi:hypothetical protein